MKLLQLRLKLSSCQIFNVKNQVQTDSLGGLALFLEYGTRAKEVEDGQEEIEDELDEIKARPFQRLEFLIRDWKHWEQFRNPAQPSPPLVRQQVLCSH